MIDKLELANNHTAAVPVIPFNEVNIKFKDQDNHINYRYGLTVNLKQDDLPYDPATGTSENAHFVVCADTVIIDSTLLNPGKDISIFARKLVCKSGAVIVTTAPPPSADWLPGVEATQADRSAGVEGAAGTNGGTGGNAGNITIRAEMIVNDVASTGTGTITLVPREMGDFLKNRVQGQIAGFNTRRPTLPDTTLTGVPIPISGLLVPIDVPANTISITALENITTSARWDPLSGKAVVECKGNAKTALRISIGVNGFAAIGHITGTNDLLFSQTYSVNPGTQACTADGNPKIECRNPVITLTWPDDLTKMVMESMTPVLKDGIGRALMTYFNTGMETAIKTLFENVNAGTGADLVLAAKGGRGGRAQDGHAGMQGAMGGRGASRKMTQAEAAGGRGLTGGKGGSAGTPGKGGNAGRIDIYVVKGGAQIGYSATGGDAGPRGMGNIGGAGGLGGPGGTWLAPNPVPSGMPPLVERPGGDGPDGYMGESMRYLGVQGTCGSDSTCVKTTATNSDLAKGMFAEQLLITQRTAQFAYIAASNSAEYEYPVALAGWLYKITAAISASGFSATQWNEPAKQVAASIRSFSETMIGNFQRGLDFYGHYRNWVPILSLDSYQKRIDQLIVLGKIIEDQYVRYQDEATRNEDKLAAINMVKEKLTADMEHDKAEITELQDQITKLDKLATELTTTLQHHTRIVNAAEELFTKEFKAYTSEKTGCSFMQVIEVVTIIVSAGAGVVGTVKSIKEAYNKLTDLSTVFDQIKFGIKVLQDTKATIDELKKSYAKMSGIIDPAKKEGGLMIAEKESFDKMIKEYLGEFGAAQKLKDAVDQMFSLIETRNEAVCTYTAHFINAAKRQAELDQKKAQLAQLVAIDRLLQSNPALPAYTAFMQHAYSSLKTVLVCKLYEENRAYEYWSLKERTFSTHDVNMAMLSKTHADLLIAIDEAKARKGPFQPFTQKIIIKTADWDIPFRIFTTTRKFSFTFRADMPEFKHWYQVIVSNVQIELPDIKRTNDVFELRLIHSGVGYQVADPGKPQQQFVHLPRTVPYRIDYKNPLNTGGGVIGDNETAGGKQGYAGLSPFTTWTLDFSLLSDSEFAGLEKMKTIELTFKGSFTTPQLLRAYQLQKQTALKE